MSSQTQEVLLPAVSNALEDLQLCPSPILPSPPDVPKRASVALILRVQPNPAHLPTGNERLPEAIADFFELPWVSQGEAEVLFIKRAARKDDRWTAHVAFPGGKRDKEDVGDLEVALRETLEEVGLDLDREQGFRCGHLPDRLITASWELVPLMVLCPYVFLLTSPNPPALHLQPTEVASAHWVPLRILLEPAFRTSVQCDVFDRLARRGTNDFAEQIRYVLRACLGQMEYTGIRLWPSLSYFSTFGKDWMAPAQEGRYENSLVLWGLTLGIVEDFIDMLPPIGGAAGLFNWPTFTAWDVRLVVNLMTRNLRKRNLEIAKKESVAAAMHKDGLSGKKGEERTMGRSIVDIRDSQEDEDWDVGESGVLIKRPRALSEARKLELKVRGGRERLSSFNTLMHGYNDILRKAIWVTMTGRVVVGTAVVGAIVWRVRG